jgi:hypothetical protein
MTLICIGSNTARTVHSLGDSRSNLCCQSQLHPARMAVTNLFGVAENQRSVNVYHNEIYQQIIHHRYCLSNGDDLTFHPNPNCRRGTCSQRIESQKALVYSSDPFPDDPDPERFVEMRNIIVMSGCNFDNLV